MVDVTKYETKLAGQPTSTLTDPIGGFSQDVQGPFSSAPNVPTPDEEYLQNRGFGIPITVDEPPRASDDFGLLAQGAYNVMAGLPQGARALTNVPMQGYARIFEAATGQPMFTYDPDLFGRLFMAPDYSSVDKVGPFEIGTPFNFVGPTSFPEKLMRAGTEGLSLQAPFSALFREAYKIGSKAGLNPGAITEILEEGSKLPLMQSGFWKNVGNNMLQGYAPRTAANMAAIDYGFGAASNIGANLEMYFNPNWYTGLGAMAPAAFPNALAVTGGLIMKLPLIKHGRNMLGTYRDEYIAGKEQAENSKNIDARSQRVIEFNEKIKTDLEKAINRTDPAEIEQAQRTTERLQEFADQGKTVEFTAAEQTLDPSLIKSQEYVLKSDSTRPETIDAQIDRQETILSAVRNLIVREISPSEHLGDPPVTLLDMTGAPTYKQLANYNLEKAELELTPGQIIDSEPQTTGGKLQLQLARWFDDISKVGKEYQQTNLRSEAGADIRQTVQKLYSAAQDNVTNFANLKKIKESWSKEAASKYVKAAQEKLIQMMPAARSKDPTQFRKPASERLSRDEEIVNRFLNYNTGPGKAKLGWADYLQFRKEVMNEIVDAQARGKSVERLVMLQDVLDDIGVSYGKTFENLQTFNQRWKDEVIGPFQGGFLKLLEKGPGFTEAMPIYKITDSEIATQFLNKPDSAAAYFRMFGDDPIKMAYMRNAIYDDMYRQGYNSETGVISPKAVNDWVKNHSEELKNLGLYDEFFVKADQGTILQKEIASRRAVLAKNKESIESNLMLTALNRAIAMESPLAFFDDVLKTPATARLAKEEIDKLVAESGNEGLRRAFQGQVWKAVQRATTSATGQNQLFSSPERFAKYITDNEEALKNVFSQTHLDDLRLIADATKRLQSVGLIEPKGTSFNSTIDNIADQLGVSVASLSTRLLALREKRIGKGFFAFYVLTRALNAQSGIRHDQILERAMFDNKFANLLTKPLNKQNLPKLKKQFYAVMASAGMPGEMRTTDTAGIQTYYLGFPEDVPADQIYQPLFGEDDEEIIDPEKTNPNFPRPKPLRRDFSQLRPPEENIPTSMRAPISTPPAPTAPMNPAQYGAMFPQDELGQAIAQQGVAPGGLGDLA
jgi:hypothetical protein